MGRCARGCNDRRDVGYTKFVGRQREMDAMKAAAEQAKAGHGQIVAAMAEAGVGKSRLIFEFKATSAVGLDGARSLLRLARQGVVSTCR